MKQLKRPNREPDLSFTVPPGYGWNEIVISFWWKERIQTNKEGDTEHFYKIYYKKWKYVKLGGAYHHHRYCDVHWFISNQKLIMDSYYSYLVERSLLKDKKNDRKTATK